jgi:hypothetical protein
MHVFAVSLAITLAMKANVEAQVSDFPSHEVAMSQVYFALDYRIFLTREESKWKPGTDQYRWVEKQKAYLRESFPIWCELWHAQDKLEPLKNRVQATSSLRTGLLETHWRIPPIVAYWDFRDGPPPPKANELDAPPPLLPAKAG